MSSQVRRALRPPLPTRRSSWGYGRAASPLFSTDTCKADRRTALMRPSFNRQGRRPVQPKLSLPSFVSFIAISVLGCATEPVPDSRSVPPTEPSAAEEARMKAYIDSRVDKRYVRATFNPGNGSDGFCVDFDKQPSCLASPGSCPSSPPAPPPPQPTPSPVASTITPPPPPLCPEGTVPILVPQLEALRRFPTLDDYLCGMKCRGREPR